jgi:hypothetical protein
MNKRSAHFVRRAIKEGVATALDDRGTILFRAGDLAEARKLQDEARGLAVEMQEPPNVAAVDVAIAEILAEEGEAKGCQARAEAAAAEFHKEQNLAYEAEAQAILGLCFAMQSQFPQADEAVAKAGTLAIRSGVLETQLNAKSKAAEVNLRSGKPDRLRKARTLAAEVVSEAHRRGFVWYETEAHLLLGEIEMASGETVTGRLEERIFPLWRRKPRPRAYCSSPTGLIGHEKRQNMGVNYEVTAGRDAKSQGSPRPQV